MRALLLILLFGSMVFASHVYVQTSPYKEVVGMVEQAHGGARESSIMVNGNVYYVPIPSVTTGDFLAMICANNGNCDVMYHEQQIITRLREVLSEADKPFVRMHRFAPFILMNVGTGVRHLRSYIRQHCQQYRQRGTRHPRYVCVRDI